MKMRKQILFLTIAVIYSIFFINAKEMYISISAKTAKQYTTSEAGNLRLSYMGKLQFESHGQALEAGTSIFINKNNLLYFFCFNACCNPG